jgi:alanyl-tRNA synthetase
MKTNEIRKSFLEFFKNKNHKILPSDSLIPANDPTLLFTSAGMVQFKPYYLNPDKAEVKRVTTCQKCFRTQDLEKVGVVDKYHTFFEMLGNFSFGDYFKKEAISYAWEFTQDVLKLPKEKIWISIYFDDDEAFEIWNKYIGIPKEKIVRLGKEDNFWGPVSPQGGICGPCSELYFDLGIEKGCKKETCKPGCTCERFEEFWNLVFPSFNMDANGVLHPLEKPGIDTGMGLERVAKILQNVTSNFEIDIIYPIIKKIEEITNVKYNSDKRKDIAIKIIADHIRAIVFAIGDGVFPSNEGRGYVLRRIIRRAIREGKVLNINTPFLHKISSKVIEIMKDTYSELFTRKEYIEQVIISEEKKFYETLERGLLLIEDIIEKYKEKKIVPGEEAFKLYDTYGFPIELTQEILKEKNMKVDENEFNIYLEKQKEKGRISWKVPIQFENLIRKIQIETEFVGYDTLEIKSKVVAIIKNNELVERINAGEEGWMILTKTPFYPESGGQIGDTGIIAYKNGTTEVHDTKKLDNIIIHKIKVFRGEVKINDDVEPIVDKYRRSEIARSHTATHLLQYALRKVLGIHVMQSGSEVSPGKLRFDFTHFSPLSELEIEKVEEIVNFAIKEVLPVNATVMKFEDAKEIGALAFFQEKYSDYVRVISIGEISKELCGGTHVSSTGEIGMFKIISETGIATGIRRIEAVVGNYAFVVMKKQQKIIKSLSQKLNTSYDSLVESVEKLINKEKELEKELLILKENYVKSNIDIKNDVKSINGIKVIAKRIDGLDFSSLRRIGDYIKSQIQSGVILIGGVVNDNAQIICMVSEDLTNRISAKDIIENVTRKIDGKGGGKSTLAQAGGKNIQNINTAIELVYQLIP